MILADSNILIEYFRSRKSPLAKKIDSMSIGICGPVRTELLHGAKNDKEADNILAAFKTFEPVYIDEYDWDVTGLMLQTMKKCGFSVPVTDALIAYTAMKYDIPLWTRDAHFKIIQAVYPELKLYEE